MDDFTATNHGSIVMLAPNSDAARDWVAENLPDDIQTLGDAVAIEPRYFADIALGIFEDGLTGNFEVTPA